jgi:hypothetical protein
MKSMQVLQEIKLAKKENRLVDPAIYANCRHYDGMEGFWIYFNDHSKLEFCNNSKRWFAFELSGKPSEVYQS